MPRKLRQFAPGACYHAILRGNNRQDLFRCSGDYVDWLELLQTAAHRYHCRLLAYCWMTNHVHMAVQVSAKPLGTFVQYLASQYARRFNRRHEKTGHVFERRHRAIIVQTSDRLLTLIRYIHRNPIDAAIVPQVRAYPLCSHRHYLTGKCPTWLHTDLVLSLLGLRFRNPGRS